MNITLYKILNILQVRQIIILILLSVSIKCIAQTKFNKVINPEHPSMNILVSTTPIDDGYILVIGSRNVEGYGNNRCSMILKTDNIGNVLYRNFVCDSSVNVYEGWFDQKIIATNYGTYKYAFHKEWLCSYICEFDEQLNPICTKSIYFSNDSSLVNVKMTGFSNVDDCLYFPNIAKIDTLGTELYHPVLYKLDSNNNLIYKKGLYIGNYKHQYTSIIKAHDDNLIAFGEMKSVPVWLVSKIDPAGNMIWYHTYGRANWNNGLYKFIAPSPDSCYVMSGLYPVCYADRFEYRTANAACIRKIDDNGNLLWEKNIKNYYSNYYNGPGIHDVDCTYDLYVDDDGYIYVAGQGTIFTGFTGFLTKLSPEGDIMFRRYYTPDGSKSGPELYLNSVKPTPDGGLIMGGYTYDSYYTAAEFGDYYQQPWLVKTDMDGLDGLCYTELPELTLDVFIPDTVCNLDTIDCVVNISGPSAPYRLDFSTGQTIENIYYPDVFVPKEIGIDTVLTGERMYQYTETITEATLKDTAVEDIIARHYNIRTPRDPGEHQLAITLSDYYGNTKTIYKDIYVNPCHDLAVDENDNIMLSVYPNPATEYINIAGENIAEIQICNLLGEVVYYIGNVAPRHDTTNVISTENMPAGSYFVSVRMVNGKVVTKKIIVVKD